MTEAQTGTRGTLTTHAARPLLILAADHRNSLERDLYGLTAAPTPEQAARISADKMLIYQALLDAGSHLPASVQPGILIDEQYGAAIADLAARTDGAISLAMPIEASGEQWFHYAYDDWQAHAGFFAADHTKILIRDNPGLEPGQRAAQAERVAKVSDWAAASDRALIVELLVPASDADLAAAGGAVASYDVTLRPEHTVQVIEYLQDHGVTPALWRWRASTATTMLSRSPRPPSAAGEPPTASSAAGTQVMTSLITGCRSRPQFRASLASPSAAVSGGTRCTPICITASPPVRPGARSPAPTSTSCVTSSTPAKARCRCSTSPKPCNRLPETRRRPAGNRRSGGLLPLPLAGSEDCRLPG